MVIVVHFIKLVYAADTIVSQHQRTSFDPHYSSLVFGHAGSQTCRTCGLAVGVHTPRDKLVDSLEELGFGSGRIPHDEDVDIASNGYFVLCGLVNTAE